MSCPELLNRLHDFWRDFNTINRWKFPELSAASLQKWLDFNLGQVDYAEFARAEWMWGRKPRSPLGKSMSVYTLLVFVGLLLLFINTILIQRTIDRQGLWARLQPEDFRALTPLFYGHINPYGLFELDLEGPSFLGSGITVPL